MARHRAPPLLFRTEGVASGLCANPLPAIVIPYVTPFFLLSSPLLPIVITIPLYCHHHSSLLSSPLLPIVIPAKAGIQKSPLALWIPAGVYPCEGRGRNDTDFKIQEDDGDIGRRVYHKGFLRYLELKPREACQSRPSLYLNK